MSDLIFPSGIQAPDYPFKEVPEDNSIKSTFEDGSVQARPKFTRSRMKWTLKWGALPTVQYKILDTFIREQTKFSSNQFTWTHPVSKKDYVVYADSYVGAELATVNYWSVELILAEV